MRLRSLCNLFSLALVLSSFAIHPSSLEAQSSGSVVITIEGSITLAPSAPPSAPVAPPSASPPTVIIDAPIAPPVVAPPVIAPAPQSVVVTPAPMVLAPTASAAYVPPSQSLTVAPLEAPRVRRRWGLVAAGAGIAIGAYALNIGGTVLALAWPFSNGHRDELFFSSLVPVAGPLMQIAYRDEDWQIPFYIASSALQIAGFAMAFAGTFSTTTTRATEASVTVLPYASSDGMGVVAGGRF